MLNVLIGLNVGSPVDAQRNRGPIGKETDYYDRVREILILSGDCCCSEKNLGSFRRG